MIGSLTKALKKVFGDKYQRDLKEATPLVAVINEAFAKLNDIGHDELRARSLALKARITDGTRANDERVQQLRSEIDADAHMDIQERCLLYTSRCV